MPQHQFKRASRIEWSAPVKEEGGYPGDNEVKIGCLQRIADATEIMAKNHQQLISDKQLYERWWKEGQLQIARLTKSNAALRGVINRMKKTRKP